ncbi:purple acid phosphatase family protein [Streptomyces sp. Act-28]
MSDALSRRSLFKGAAVVAGAAAGPVLWARPGAAATPPSGLHLAYGADPGREMVVSWSTPASVRNPRLLLGDASGQYGQVVAVESVPSPGLATVQHHARLSGLTPNARYYYRASHDGGTGPEFDFTTAAPPSSRSGKPVRFTAFGDQGTSNGKVAPVLPVISRFGPDLHLHVGDLSYASNTGGLRASETASGLQYRPGVWDTWLGGIQPVAARIPWMPVLGNHEMEPTRSELGYESYFARFVLPDNGVPHPVGPTTWSLRIGNVAFVALDGNDASAEIVRNHDYLGGRQEPWLDATLSAYRGDPRVDWIVVGFHHCAFCSSSRHGSDAGVRDRWTPIFDRHRVDVVINGHNHMYERTHPVRGGRVGAYAPKGATVHPESDGTTYLVSGLATEDEPLPDQSTGPASFVTTHTGTDLGARVPETAPWSAVVDELSPVVICAEATPRDRSGLSRLRITGVDAATGTTVDAVTLERKRGE